MLFAITQIPARTDFRLVEPICDMQATDSNIDLSLSKVPHIVLFAWFFLLTAAQLDRIGMRMIAWSFIATFAMGLLVEFEEGATGVLATAVPGLAMMIRRRIMPPAEVRP